MDWWRHTFAPALNAIQWKLAVSERDQSKPSWQRSEREIAEVIVIVSIALGALRLAGVTHIAFQAAAHLWVAGLLIAGIKNIGWGRGGKRVLTELGQTDQRESDAKIRRGWWYVGITIALSVLETACAIFGTLGG
jgi:hypothetical protein